MRALTLLGACFSVGAAACGNSAAQPTDGGAVEDVLRRDVTVSADGGVGTDDSSSPDALASQDATSSDVATEVSGTSDAGGWGGLTFSNSGDAGIFLGIFVPAGVPTPPGCTLSTIGPCDVGDCPTPGVTDGGSEAVPSAGTITITGPALGVAGVALVQNNGLYYYSTNGQIFSKGDTLGASATGADVPAFALHTVVAPGVITVTSPSLPPDGGAIVVPTSTDLSFTWTGGQAGAMVQMGLTAYFQNQGYSQIVCQWPATAGSGQIPAAALGTLISASPLESGSVVWDEYTQTPFNSGEWNISLLAETSGGVNATFE